MAALLFLFGVAGCGDPIENSGNKQYNVLLVTVDTLRADHVGAYGCDAAATPNMDRLASEGILFEKAYSPCPLTLPSHISIMTGAYPFAHGARNNGVYSARKQLTTLAEALESRGYRTGAVIGAFVLDSMFGLDQGFEEYDDAIVYGRKGGSLAIPERKADEVTQRAIAFLGRQEKSPFFLWVHYFDPHSLYQPPEPFAGRYAENPYDGEIAYVDEQLGLLLKVLKMKGHTPNTLVVVTSDHGESLYEHGEETHGIFVYDSTLHVPLIVSNPVLFPRQKSIDTPVSLVDIMPTVLDILNIEPEGMVHGFAGRSLVPLVTGEAASVHDHIYFETLLPYFDLGWAGLRGVRAGRFKYIASPEPELFNTADDPVEMKNLYEEGKAEGGKLHAVLMKLLHGSALESRNGREGSGAGMGVDDDVQEKLSALGYASGAEHNGIEGDPFSGPDPKSRIWVQAELDRATRMFQGEKYNEAMPALERLYEEEPGNPDVVTALAVISERLGRLNDAEQYYKRLLNIRPDSATAMHNLALVYDRQGRTEDAFEGLEKTLEMDPEHADACFNLAVIYAGRGEQDMAEKLWMRAATIQPNYVLALFNLGSLYANRGDYEAAVEWFEKALEKDPGLAKAHHNLAKACVMLEQPEKAVRHLTLAMRFGAEIEPELADKLKPWLNKRAP